ncbi:MAG: NCS2 family permease [Clostridia bacterium]|nr:NCS2 family permease [Clostridia bacterium]
MDKFFKIKERGSSYRKEIIGGFTTFFAMAYIIFVNPSMLQATGMDAVGVAVATCLSACLGTLLTALLGNVPFAQAPGMGLNAFFTYTVCFGMGFTWQQALTIVLISGILFLLISLSPLRSKVIASIPMSLKSAISAGIGLFVTLIALLNSGVVVLGSGVPDFGAITKGSCLLVMIGLIITIILMVCKVKGALFLGILATAAVGLIPTLLGSDFFGVFTTVDASGAEVAVYDITKIANISKVAFKFDFAGLFTSGTVILSFITAVVSFFICDMFDTIGTLIGTAGKAGMLDQNGNLPGGDRALIADAIATCAGSCMGTSTVTTFVESSAGISAGAKTGFSSLIVSALFGLSVLITPIFGILSLNAWFIYAITAPALIIVGVLMMGSAAKVKWDDLEEAIPCFLTIALMPFAYSISDGIGFGFISYTIIKVCRGKAKQVPILMYILSALFIAMYILSNL